MTMGAMEVASVSIPGTTVIELVTHWGTGPEKSKPSFICVDASGRKRELTREDVLTLASRFAHKLKENGAAKGKVVCNALPNSLERVICEFGIVFSGATSMNGQIFRADGEDFFDALRTSKCPIVITDPAVPNGARQLLLREVPVGSEDCIKSKMLPHLEKLLICARDDDNCDNDFISSLRDPDLPTFIAQVSPSDISNIMTTSGSTGYSKLVKLTHANICHFGRQVKAIEPFASGERFINCAPLGWAGGYPQWYLACGVTRYFIDMHDGPVKDLSTTIWKTIVSEKIVYGFLQPVYVSAILDNPTLWENASWKPRTLCLAGQPVKKSHMQIIGKLCSSVDVNYGMTECNLVTTHRTFDPDLFIDSCAGYAGYGVKIKVVDQNRKPVAQGVTGEILLQSPSLCVGYLNNDAAYNARFTSDGWFCTDDAGFMEPDGKLHVEGRQSDSIMRGAYILYPGWLEQKLKEVSGVRDVVVVAVPDPVLHSEICACVVVDGLHGVVPGLVRDGHSGSDSYKEADDFDHVDNASFTRIYHRDISGPSHEQAANHQPIGKPGSHFMSQTMDTIRAQGLQKPLSVPFNVTKSKPMDRDLPSESKISRVDTHKEKEMNVSSRDQICTLELEERLRQHADSLQILSKRDAMRMVPKYYVFIDKLPLTNTFKVSRKEVRKIVVDALQL